MANSVTRTLILAEAVRRGWKTETIGPNAYFCKIIHPDGRWNLLHGTSTMRNSAPGQSIAKYKNLTMDFVKSYGYEVPPYELVESDTQALDFLEQQGTIVVKPVDGQRTEGVSVAVRSPEKLAAALRYAQANSESQQAMLQTHLSGNLYRLLVLDGQFVAGSWRRAAVVVGDGQHSVRQLIELANADPLRGHGVSTALKTIDLEQAVEHLGDERLASIPEAGARVVLSAIDSVSAGGEAINVTDKVHEDWRRVTIQLANEAGLFICGYDVMCSDISQPIQNNYLPLLEMNAAPGMKIHEYPTGGGDPIHLAPLLLDALFPES
jgi:cyanophycin synthetase